MPINNPHGGTQWSDEHCAELTRLLATGMVYREIAATLNSQFGTAYSKNSIVGKVQRLGLTAPEKPKAPPYVRKPKKPRRAEMRVLRIVSANSNSNAMRVVNTVVVERERMRCVEIECVTTLDDVTGCRYPEGDGPFLFCNGTITHGSYCTPHHFLCTEKPRVPIYKFVGRDAA